MWILIHMMLCESFAHERSMDVFFCWSFVHCKLLLFLQQQIQRNQWPFNARYKLKPGFHYPSWRVIWRARVSTSRVDGPSTRLVETRARQHGPCWRVMETGHPSTGVVETGLKYWYKHCGLYAVSLQVLHHKPSGRHVFTFCQAHGYLLSRRSYQCITAL